MKKWTALSMLCLLAAPLYLNAAERLAVSGPKVNIRSGPAVTYEVVWEAERFYPVQVVERSGDWILFRDFEGAEGWIHRSLVDKTGTVITKKDVCNIRSGPDQKQSVLATVGAGIPFKVLARKSGWLQVQHADGDTGWIHESLVW